VIFGVGDGDRIDGGKIGVGGRRSGIRGGV